MAALPAAYDFTKSTEMNWMARAGDAIFVGRYRSAREKLDYRYHRNYAPARQLFQDQLVERFVSEGRAGGKPWVVFTAGAMGAGKGYTVDRLVRGLLRLESPVVADPDRVRSLLPESAVYKELNRYAAGDLTQKESGFVSELVQREALRNGVPLVIDGSLRNEEWPRRMIEAIRKDYPNYRIAIVHVEAGENTTRARAAKRARLGGRAVPTSEIEDSLASVPRVVKRLSPFVDALIEVDNSNTVPRVVGPLPSAVAIDQGPLPRATRLLDMHPLLHVFLQDGHSLPFPHLSLRCRRRKEVEATDSEGLHILSPLLRPCGSTPASQSPDGVLG